MFTQNNLYYFYLDKALTLNTIDYNSFFFTVVTLLSPEVFLITVIILYLCFIKNFNSFYINSFCIHLVLVIELFIILYYGLHYALYFKSQLFFLSSFSVDFYSICCKLCVIIFLIIILNFSRLRFTWNPPTTSDIYIPVYFLLLFSLILLSSCDLLLSYLALEGVSLALYTLTINTYHKRVAIEATLKYFVSGGFSSGLFIYGNSIIFGLTGTSNYIQIKHTLRSVFVSFDLQNYVATVDVITPSTIEVCFSTICFLTTFFFKVAAFPCHMWAPDVYVGVWLPITTILIVLVKLIFFFFFFKVFFYVLVKLAYLWQPLILLSSFGSLIVGSLGVIGQNRIKRIIAYSSITHVSFILLGMGCGTVIALTTTILYVLVYSATLLLFFGFMLNTQCFVTGRSLVYLSDFANLGSRGLLITLFSMGGLPPFAGFFIKFYIYICAISSGFYILVILNLLITILTTFYYLFFLKCVFFDTSLWSKLVYFNFLCSWHSIIIYTLCFLLTIFFLIRIYAHMVVLQMATALICLLFS